MSVKEYDETNHDEIAALLVGRRIVEVQPTDEQIPGARYSFERGEGVLILDDGTRLYLLGNEGCACPSGNYPLTAMATAPNIITSVSFEDNPADDGDEHEGHYSIYVWAENQKIEAARFEGTDGNGYYGTGYRIYVVPAEATA